jgi:hypothetical protein
MRFVDHAPVIYGARWKEMIWLLKTAIGLDTSGSVGDVARNALAFSGIES